MLLLAGVEVWLYTLIVYVLVSAVIYVLARYSPYELPTVWVSALPAGAGVPRVHDVLWRRLRALPISAPPRPPGSLATADSDGAPAPESAVYEEKLSPTAALYLIQEERPPHDVLAPPVGDVLAPAVADGLLQQREENAEIPLAVLPRVSFSHLSEATVGEATPAPSPSMLAYIKRKFPLFDSFWFTMGE